MLTRIAMPCRLERSTRCGRKASLSMQRGTRRVVNTSVAVFVADIPRSYENIADAQALLFLLRRCHGLIYRLMSESEPISEELMPVVGALPSFMPAVLSRSVHS